MNSMQDFLDPSRIVKGKYSYLKCIILYNSNFFIATIWQGDEVGRYKEGWLYNYRYKFRAWMLGKSEYPQGWASD